MAGRKVEVRPNVKKMRGYVPGEQPRTKIRTKLNTNEFPGRPLPAVIAAVRREASSLQLYPDPNADRLRDVAARVFGFTRDNILAGNGSDDLLTILFRTFAGPGDLVVAPRPTYTLYEELAKIQDVRFEYVDFPADYSVPETITRKNARLTLFPNPNAPTGTRIEKSAMRKLARRIDGVLVIDEAYVDFAPEDCLELARSEKNVIVTRSFSKSHALAGIRLGLAFGAVGLISEMAKVKDSYNVCRLAQAAGVAALENLKATRARIAGVIRRREKLVFALTKLGFDTLPSAANFVFARPPHGRAGELFAFLRRRGVLVRYFDAPGLNDRIRITIGTAAEMQLLLAEVAAFLKKAGA